MFVNTPLIWVIFRPYHTQECSWTPLWCGLYPGCIRHRNVREHPFDMGYIQAVSDTGMFVNTPLIYGSYPGCARHRNVREHPFDNNGLYSGCIRQKMPVDNTLIWVMFRMYQTQECPWTPLCYGLYSGCTRHRNAREHSFHMGYNYISRLDQASTVILINSPWCGIYSGCTKHRNAREYPFHMGYVQAVSDTGMFVNTPFIWVIIIYPGSTKQAQ